MKRLVMIANESLFSGVIKCGMAEMVDSLANSLSLEYAVTLICPDGNGLYIRAGGAVDATEPGVKICRFSNVEYYMVDPNVWSIKVVELINRLQPDILHNFTEPELLSKLQVKPSKTVYTFDSVDQVSGKEQYLSGYNSITTTSVSYASGLMRRRSGLSTTLLTSDFHGITNGITSALFAPEKGFLLAAKYTSDNQSGKVLCKQRLMDTYGIKGNPSVYLLMCRLVKEKGIDDIIAAIPTIRDSGGVLVVVGRGDATYEKLFKQLRLADGVVYVDRWASPLQAAPLTSGADFFLQPSIEEPCGLMPMTASRYGAIPIVTRNGGLADNFNEDNAIIVEENSLNDAILRAAALYSDKEALAAKRKICMDQDFSWTTRKQGYIDLYEKE